MCGLNIATYIRTAIVQSAAKKKGSCKDFDDISDDLQRCPNLEDEVEKNVLLFFAHLREAVNEVESGDVRQMSHLLHQCESSFSVKVASLVDNIMKTSYSYQSAETDSNFLQNQIEKDVDSWEKNCLAKIDEFSRSCLPLIIQQKELPSQYCQAIAVEREDSENEGQE